MVCPRGAHTKYTHSVHHDTDRTHPALSLKLLLVKQLPGEADEMTILRHSLIIDPKKQFSATVSWEKLGHGLWKGTSCKSERVPGLRTISNVQFLYVIHPILRQ